MKILAGFLIASLTVYSAYKQKPLDDHSSQAFANAKFGLFFHYGPYAVPGFAPQFDPIGKMGTEDYFLNNPYAEWYFNSMNIPGSPTQIYHASTYGIDYPYANFVKEFDLQSQKWNPQEWVDLIKISGAKYAVLTAKHHDGVLLFKSGTKNKKHSAELPWETSRDIVGEFVQALRKNDIMPGVYYSSGYDWIFNSQYQPIKNGNVALLAMDRSVEYADYTLTHWKEIIDRYEPAILWGDIYFPRQEHLVDLVRYYREKVPTGVINDRWGTSTVDIAGDFLSKSSDASNPVSFLSGRNSYLRTVYDQLIRDHASDFDTVEYSENYEYSEKKWELTRGAGYSFGYNRLDDNPDKQHHLLSLTELTNDFVRVISQNGNYLFAVTPRADGSIPEYQVRLLRQFGEWNQAHSEAIFNTKPFLNGKGRSSTSATEVYFTQASDSSHLYIFLVNRGENSCIDIMDFPKPSANTLMNILGKNKKVNFTWQANYIFTGAGTLHLELENSDESQGMPIVIKLSKMPGID